MEGQPQHVVALVAAQRGGDVDVVARQTTADHGGDLAGNRVVDVQHRTDLHANWWMLPPIAGHVDVDDVLVTLDLQAQELPSVLLGGFEHLDLAARVGQRRAQQRTDLAGAALGRAEKIQVLRRPADDAVRNQGAGTRQREPVLTDRSQCYLGDLGLETVKSGRGKLGVHRTVGTCAQVPAGGIWG